MNAKATTRTIGLTLEPLDVLFFRSGRPFPGSERSVSGLPMPQTFAGAVRTALLRIADCDFRQLGNIVKGGGTFAEAVRGSCRREFHWIAQASFRGPWIARRKGSDEDLEVLVPVPAVVQAGKHDAGICRLQPLPAGQLPGWELTDNLNGLRPLWLKDLEPTNPIEGYLKPAGLIRLLEGGVPEAQDIVPVGRLLALDNRTGIGISPDRLTAADSEIFGRGFLALETGVVLYGEIVLSGTNASDLLDEISLLPLGGEGRYVRVERLESPHKWPGLAPTDGRKKPLVILTTPCAFQAGWHPQSLTDKLVSAAVPGSIAFSGWDLARGTPKPTRFAIPAGSTFFLEQAPPNWPLSLAESDVEQQLGWGSYVIGFWNDE